MRLNQSLKFAHVLAVCAALMLSFFALKVFDEQAIIGATSRVTVLTSTKEASGSEVLSALAKIARIGKTEVAVRTNDPSSPTTGEILYGIESGDSGSTLHRWVTSGYESFSRDTQRSVHPVSEIPSDFDPRTSYYVFGGDSQAEEVVQVLQGLGYRSMIEPTFTLSHAASFFLGGAQLWCVFLVVLLLAVLGLTGTLLDSRRYAIAILQGHSIRQLMLTLAAQNFLGIARTVLAVSPVVAVALWLYNGLNHAILYALVSVALTVSLFMMCLVMQVISVGIIGRSSLLATVRGAVPFASGSLLSYAMRIPAILLLLISVQGMLPAIWEMNNAQAVRSSAENLGPTSILLINDDAMRQPVTLAKELRRLSSSHKIILATALSNPSPDDGTSAILVNDKTYSAAAGTHLAHSQELLAVLPNGKFDDSASIVNQLRSDYVLRNNHMPFRAVDAQREVPIVAVAATGVTPTMPTSQVVVVAPDDSLPLTDGDLVAAAGRGEVMAADHDTALDLVTNEKVRTYIAGVVPSTQLMGDQMANSAARLRFALIDVIMAAGVAIASGFVVSLIYMAHRGQRDYVRFLHGWSFFQANPYILLVEVLGTVGVCVYAVSATIRAQQILSNPHPDISPSHLPRLVLGGWDWLPTVMIVVLSHLAFWWVLRSTHSKSVSSLSAQA